MPADLHASAYLVDGVALAATGVALTHDGSGLYDGVGEDVFVTTYPGTDGGAITGGAFQPFTLSTMYLVQAHGFDAVWAAIRALRRRCKPGRTVTLTRTMPDPDGTDANVSHTTTARRQGRPRVEWIGDSAATVDLDWLVADSPWHGSAVVIASAAGVQSVAGDIATHRMTLTLAAGAARTVANNNGYSVTFGATVPTGGVLIDVEARTATAITGGADLSGSLSWSKKFLMQLEAGSNTLTVSAGSASISYQPAYL